MTTTDLINTLHHCRARLGDVRYALEHEEQPRLALSARLAEAQTIISGVVACTETPNLAADFAKLISDTESPVALMELRRTALPHLLGILDTERRQLEKQIDWKMSAINAATVGPQKARW